MRRIVNDQQVISHSKDGHGERRFSALASQLQKPTECTNPVNDSEMNSGTKLRKTLGKTQSLRDSNVRDRYLANASKKSSTLERSNSISISKSPNSKYQSDGKPPSLPVSCHLEFLKLLVLTSFSELAMTPGEVRRKVQMFATKEESGDGYTSPKDRMYGSPPRNSSR